MVMPQFLARIARALGFSVASPHKVFIRVSPQNGVAFWPDVENATANQPLRASDKDNVSWTNETNQLVTLASVTPSDVLNFRRAIPAGESSSFYSIDIKTPLPITYRCEQHPQVHMIEDAASPLVALNQAAIDNG